MARGGPRTIPPVDELVRLYQTYTIPEIARMYGVSKQRISYELHRVGATTGSRGKNKLKRHQELIEAIKRLREEEPGLNWQEIAKRVGWSAGYCTKVAREYGIDTLKPIGCPECKTKHYAKGLCRNCYHNQLRRSKNNG